ncbi:MAG: phage portal protein [Epsilonproteobacteria bacterium]|nr:phage portal protein [Campylobacterota bacterium]
MSNEDSQFLETRKFQKSEICGIYRVPPHLIGDLEKATFSNIEQQSIDFVTHSLRPYLIRIEQSINTQLLTSAEQKNYYVKFNIDALLRGDTKSRYEAYNMGRNMGVLSANDIRAKEDMNPIDNGDVYLQPLNMGEAGKGPDGKKT